MPICSAAHAREPSSRAAATRVGRLLFCQLWAVPALAPTPRPGPTGLTMCCNKVACTDVQHMPPSGAPELRWAHARKVHGCPPQLSASLRQGSKQQPVPLHQAAGGQPVIKLGAAARRTGTLRPCTLHPEQLPALAAQPAHTLPHVKIQVPGNRSTHTRDTCL